MTEILEKNLTYIRSYNPSLYEKIMSVKEYSKSFELRTNLVGEYNLLINGMPVHSITGAQEEAKSVFSNLPHNTRNSLHVIYGLGLGYLYDEFAENALGSVILYEPDIELLHFVLETVDLSANFAKNNTYFASDCSEFRELFEQVFRYKTKTSFSALDYHVLHHKNEYQAFKQELERVFGLVSHNYSFQVNSIYTFLYQTLHCLEKRLTAPLLTDYKNLLKGKPAVIVSAGPSLAKNIEFLKKNKDNVYIFCVGTALKALLSNGIIPDFLHVIEKANTMIHFQVPEAKDMILVSEPYTNATIFNLGYKKIVLTASEETDTARWFLEKRDTELVNFETKGTVSYHALFSAKYLGCNPLILIGQDLAYSDGQCYAKGSAFEDLECIFDDKTQKYKIQPSNYEKYRDSYFHNNNFTAEEKNQMLDKLLQKFNSEIVTVEGQDGKKLPTSSVYALFIEYIKDFGSRFNKEVKLINSSSGGAKIEGFETLSLENALLEFANTPLEKPCLSDVFKPLNFSKPRKIIENLNKDVEVIKPLIPLFEKGKRYVNNLKEELERTGVLSQKADDYLQKASALYADITNNYTNKSRLLRMVVMKEHCEINYLMKEFNGNLDYQKAQIFLKVFEDYFCKIPWRLNFIIKSLNSTSEKLEELYESCNTKS